MTSNSLGGVVLETVERHEQLHRIKLLVAPREERAQLPDNEDAITKVRYEILVIEVLPCRKSPHVIHWLRSSMIAK